MSQRVTMRAAHMPATQTITLDGLLDEQAWRETPCYQMGPAQPEVDKGKAALEGGAVRLLWDDDHLYVGVELIDSDVVQDDDRDQRPHYETGDLIEVFLKPEQQTYYWEFYATPQGRRTAYFFPGRGRLGLPSCFNYTSNLRVAAHVDGTLNDWRTRDRGWSAELAIPRKELATQGVPLDPDQHWRVLIARYNYSAYLPEVELTMYPPLPRLRFHQYEDWAHLEMQS